MHNKLTQAKATLSSISPMQRLREHRCQTFLLTQAVLLHMLKQHDRYVTAVAFSPTMAWMATGSMDKAVNVWRLGDGDSGQAESQQPFCQGRKLSGHPRAMVCDWSEEDVLSWLEEEGLTELVSIFKTTTLTELIRLNKETLTTELAIDGYYYEREAIEGWIGAKNRSSPMTNLHLSTNVLTPNRTLKMAIGRWRVTQ